MMRSIFFTIAFFLTLTQAQAQNDCLQGFYAYIYYNQLDSALSIIEKCDFGDIEEANYQKGIVYFKQNDYNQALIHFNTANSYKDSKLYLSKIYALMGDSPQACKFLETYLKQENKLSKQIIISDTCFLSIQSSNEWKMVWKNDWYSKEEVLFWSLESKLELGNELEVLITIENIEASSSASAQIYYLKALTYRKMLSYSNAIKALEKAIELSANLLYFELLGDLYAQTNNFNKATTAYSKLLSSETMHGHLKYGIANWKSKNYNISIEMLKRYCNLYKYDYNAFSVLANIYFDDKQINNSLLAINKAIEIAPRQVNNYLIRAKIFASSEYNLKFADIDLTTALDLSPAPEIYFQRGLVRIKLNNSIGTCSDMQKANSGGISQAEYYLNKHCYQK
ncbi:MAG: hypothetical protein IPO21_14220 [Bacteroidales bacterium]|nr:hypothetical protein [Bacteroidales bacterium]